MPLGFLGSLANGLLNYNATQQTNQMNQQIARENMAWQQQENERVHARNLELWNKENEYNSPQQQMERLNAAGLSPMLAYSSGNVGGLSSSSSPKLDQASAITPTLQSYQGWNLQAPNIGNLIDVIKKHRLINEDIRGKKLANDLLEQDIQNRKANTEGQKWLNLFNKNTQEYQQDKLRYGVENLKSTIGLNNSKYKLNQQAYEQKNKLFSFEVAAKKLGIQSQQLKNAQMYLDLKYGQDTYDARVLAVALDNTLRSSQISLNQKQRTVLHRQGTKLLHEIAGLIETNNWNKFKHSITNILGTIGNDQMSQFASTLMLNFFRSIEQLSFGHIKVF